MKSKRDIVLVIVLVAISIGLIISAFSPNKSDINIKPSKINVALIMRTAGDDYWNYLQRGADSAAREFDVQVTIYAPEFDGDVEGQLKIAKAVLDANPDVIILGANADEPFASFLNEANKSRIPIIAVDSMLTSGVTTTYIGANNFLSGQQAMDEMAQLINSRGKLVLVNYEYGGINANLREAGVLDQLKHYTNIELVRTIDCSIEIDACKEKMKWVYENEQIDGVIGLMNKPALASALALKEMEAMSSVKIIGFDSSNALLELLQEGYLQTLFVQNPFTQGYLAVQQAIDVYNGKVIKSYNEMLMSKITSENMFWLQNQKLLFPVVN